MYNEEKSWTIDKVVITVGSTSSALI